MSASGQSKPLKREGMVAAISLKPERLAKGPRTEPHVASPARTAASRPGSNRVPTDAERRGFQSKAEKMRALMLCLFPLGPDPVPWPRPPVGSTKSYDSLMSCLPLSCSFVGSKPGSISGCHGHAGREAQPL
jgi:hypothetical protein